MISSRFVSNRYYNVIKFGSYSFTETHFFLEYSEFRNNSLSENGGALSINRCINSKIIYNSFKDN